jgi:hypothetical protein
MTDVATWLAFSERLVSCGYSTVGAANIRITEKLGRDRKLVAAQLVARTLSNMRGAMLLAKSGRIVETRTLVRCCFENGFWLSRLLRDGDDFVALMHDDEERVRRSRRQSLFLDPEGRSSLDSKVEAWLLDLLKQGKNDGRKLKRLTPQDVAKDTDVGEGYLFYGVLSADAHPSVVTLDRYNVAHGDNREMAWDFDLDPPGIAGEMEETLRLACLAILGACMTAVDIWEGTRDALEPITAEYLSLAQIGVENSFSVTSCKGGDK